MREAVESFLKTTLIRVLEVEPSLKLSEGIERVLQLIPSNGFLKVDTNLAKKFLEKVGKDFQQRAVINPIWLTQEQGIGYYFYLVNSQPGWLNLIVENLKEQRENMSYYILYGIWDSLIVLQGAEEQAELFRKSIESTKYYDFAYFKAREIPLIFRYKSIPPMPSETKYDTSIIHRLANDYNSSEKNRLNLESNNSLLGPAWTFDSAISSGISAYVGIKLTGGSQSLHPIDILETLMQIDLIETCLVHLFEVDRGYPFHYFAKLVCKDLNELDEVTDEILFNRVGNVGLEGNTFIIASGKEHFPSLSVGKEASQNANRDATRTPPVEDEYLLKVSELIRDLVDEEYLLQVAMLIRELGEEAIDKFAKLEGFQQLLVLRSLDELNRQAKDRSWGIEEEKSIRSAIEFFARSSILDPKDASMIGSAMEISTGVEKSTKHALRLIGESVYGKEYGIMQNELNLPNKDIRKLSLGNITAAFQTLKNHDKFSFLEPAFENDWLERFEEFRKLRNRWAHSDLSSTFSPDRIIDDARRTIVEGIELIRWVEVDLLTLLPDSVGEIDEEAAEVMVELPKKPFERKTGVFVSYSSSDNSMAERIASGLRAVGHHVFYADWAIAPGDSIVEKINEGLAQNDNLVILLSQSSVSSRWVRRELDTTVMKQLSGQKVRIIPILIEKCDIPETLKVVKSTLR